MKTGIKPTVLELFLKKKPKTVAGITRLGFELKLIGKGLYRKVYRLVGTEFVVKIPIGKEGVKHSMHEALAYDEIRRNRKYQTLWKYLPEITYYDTIKGIILMPYYRQVDTGTKKEQKLGMALAGVMYDLFKKIWTKGEGRSIDIHSGNIGLTKYGEPVMTDMGYFYGPPEDNDETRKGS